MILTYLLTYLLWCLLYYYVYEIKIWIELKNWIDTTLFCNIDSIPEANRYIVINFEIDHISYWLASKLSSNVGETKYTIFHTNHKEVVYPDLKINNNIIERFSLLTFSDY